MHTWDDSASGYGATGVHFHVEAATSIDEEQAVVVPKHARCIAPAPMSNRQHA